MRAMKRHWLDTLRTLKADQTITPASVVSTGRPQDREAGVIMGRLS